MFMILFIAVPRCCSSSQNQGFVLQDPATRSLATRNLQSNFFKLSVNNFKYLSFYVPLILPSPFPKAWAQRWICIFSVFKLIQRSFICSVCHFSARISVSIAPSLPYAVVFFFFPFPSLILLGIQHNKSLNLIKTNSTCGPPERTSGHKRRKQTNKQTLVMPD